jgi:peptidoglycan/xylan/chitin deacetylase (PgdA/CDA1 family)
MRDLRGYGRTPPTPQWPGDARVAVSFVINFEEGAEMSLSSGDAFNEKVYEVTDEVGDVADLCMETHFAYGTKAGWWRIADSLERLGVTATLNTCGLAAALSPWLVEDAAKRGHEISCHGWRWEKHAHLKEGEEREKIARTHKVLSEITKKPVVGWHTRSTPSPNTRRLLVEHGGFLYDSDDYSDDLPFYVEVSGKKHLVIPYSFDTNDMHYHQGFHRFVTARDFAEYTIDAFDALWAEGETQPKLMSIGLHLRMVGRPGRIAALDRIITHMNRRGSVWFATRQQIAEHWRARFP